MRGLLLLVIVLNGCATLTNEPTQPVNFVVTGCEAVKNIECSVSNKRGSWTFEPPATVYIRRSDDALRVRCEAPGHRTTTQSIRSRMGGKFTASVVFLDLGITDAITDMHREYPPQVVIPACSQKTQ